MGLDGGGGGGGGILGVGNSFTGPATALEIIGDHAYAYSGLIAASTSSVTYLEFTSGSYYFVGQFQFNAPLEEADPGSGVEASCRIDFNGTGIVLVKGNTDLNNEEGSVSQNIIIPPYTIVAVKVDCHQTDANRFGSATFVGRIYR